MSLEQKIRHNFLEVPLRPTTMPYYTARNAILAGVRSAATDFRGRVADLGCGLMPYRSLILSNPEVTEYIGIDLESSSLYSEAAPNLIWDGSTIPIPNESVDVVLATELLEHLAEPKKVLDEILRVLKPGGELYATVPFVWNLHEIPHDEYRYTPYSIRRLLAEARFKSIEIKALGGFNMALAQMLALWITYSEMGSIRRKLYKRLFYPFYVYLIKTDRIPDKFDGAANSMFIGLGCSAKK